jgi:aryl-alcohol dehydrogenase-like predicted oxidoreductase
MLYRQMVASNVSVLCFGTATFVAGRLRPESNSEIGLSAFRKSLDSGINLVHSNSNLKTQWGIKQVLSESEGSPISPLHQIIKIETPVGIELNDNWQSINQKLKEALQNLNITSILGIVHEIDIKRTDDKSLLSNSKALTKLFQETRCIFNELKDAGLVNLLIGMSHTPMQLRCAIDSDAYDGFASYYNLVDNWCIAFLDELYKENKPFIGISPLKRGLLTEYHDKLCHHDKIIYQFLQTLKKKIINEPVQQFAIRYTLTHPAVKSIIVGMSCSEQVDQIVKASEKPLSMNAFRETNSEIYNYFKTQ